MVKFGIISDTHINKSDDPTIISTLLKQLQQAFNDVDEIIHVGDVCEEFFLEDLKKIAPTKCVRGNMDKITNLEDFIRFSAGKYNIGVIHKLPDNLEEFFKENELHILIYGHSHKPIIKGTPYNTLILNPGSPTKPKAPSIKKGFDKPVARPSVMTLEIEKKDIIKTFIINLKI